MDGQRFDNFTRLIGTGASRRRVLGLLAGAVTGLAGFRRETEAQECTNPESCLAGEECCAGFACDAASSTCIAVPPCGGTGAACTDPAGCCSGVCLDGACGDVCAHEGEPCGGGRVCCGFDDLGCVGGTCVEACSGFDCNCCPGSWCVAEGDECAAIACTDDGDCPTRAAGCYQGWCVDFDFRNCEFTGCEPGLECRDGFCVEPCAEEGQACGESGGPCCGRELICDDGTCARRTCTPDGEECGSFGPCCPGLGCVEIGGVACIPIGCGDIADCPSDATDCVGGVCVAGQCDIDFFCPGDLRCVDGRCIEPCAAAGEACAESGSPCCGGLVCVGGACAIADAPAPPTDGTSGGDGTTGATTTGGATTLPATGAGSEGGLDPLLGAGLAAGTAALLAAKKLRKDAATE